MFDIRTNHLLLKQALRWGVTYWDTAETYEGGNSEIGIGQFCKNIRKPERTSFWSPNRQSMIHEGLSQYLDQSLQRTNAKYFDLYFLHGINTPDLLGKDIGPGRKKPNLRGR